MDMIVSITHVSIKQGAGRKNLIGDHRGPVKRAGISREGSLLGRRSSCIRNTGCSEDTLRTESAP